MGNSEHSLDQRRIAGDENPDSPDQIELSHGVTTDCCRKGARRRELAAASKASSCVLNCEKDQSENSQRLGHLHRYLPLSGFSCTQTSPTSGNSRRQAKVFSEAVIMPSSTQLGSGRTVNSRPDRSPPKHRYQPSVFLFEYCRLSPLRRVDGTRCIRVGTSYR